MPVYSDHAIASMHISHIVNFHDKTHRW